MSALQITIGSADATNWAEVAVTALVPAAVGAGAALLGVWLSNRVAIQQREAEARERAKDAERQRGLAALALADHFETFALLCVRVVDSFWGAVWESPYNAASYATQPLYTEDLPPWPSLVQWAHLGAERAVAAENFRRRVELKRDWLKAGSEHIDPEDYHADVADLAAELGLEAWRQAKEIREQHGLRPFEWPDGLDGEDRLKEHLKQRAAIQARQAAQADPLLT